MHRVARALVAVGLGLLGTGEDLAFHPAEGATLRRTFTRVIHFDPARRTREGDGGCSSILVTDVRERFVIVDTYQEVDQGLATRIIRTFVELRGEETTTQNGLDETRSALTNSLEGRSVVFDWDDERDAYQVVFRDGERDEALLEGLVPELDLQAVLPSKEIHVGQGWDSDDQSLLLRDPGGVTLVDGGGDRRRATVESCSCRGTFRGTFDDHGVEVAVVEIEAAIRTQHEDPQAQGLALGYPIEIRVATTTEYDLHGELAWNLSASHLHSLDLRGDVTRTTRAEWPARTDTFTWSVISGGTVVLTAEVEAADD